jgi:ComF family protein
VYQDAIRDAIHALKYRGGWEIARPLASRMAEAWRTRRLTSDMLVPVPLHIDREAQRGYNQSQLLAHHLAAQTGLPLAETLLFRIRATASQARLGPRERWSNVKDAFTCVEAHDLSGLCVTLVDDVATTGATLDACAVALLARGARMVSAITLAHAV